MHFPTPYTPNSTLAMAYLGVLKIHSSHLCETRYQIVQEESNTRRIFPYFPKQHHTRLPASRLQQQPVATRQGNTYSIESYCMFVAAQLLLLGNYLRLAHTGHICGFEKLNSWYVSSVHLYVIYKMLSFCRIIFHDYSLFTYFLSVGWFFFSVLI